MSTAEDQQNFIKNNLINQIVEKFPNEKLLNYKVSHSGGLDGFMSTLYLINIKTENTETKQEKLHQLIAKFMKSDVSFRESSKSYQQFANEIFIYSKVLPYYEQIVTKSLSTTSSLTKQLQPLTPEGSETKKKSSIKVKDWAPYVYVAKYGIIEGLGDGKSNESLLVMDNIKPLGYRNGPRLYLDRNHLLLVTKILAEYHSFTYALRISKDPKLQEFIDEIIPLPFTTSVDGSSHNTSSSSSCKKNNLKSGNLENVSTEENPRKRKIPKDDDDDDDDENDEGSKNKDKTTGGNGNTSNSNNFYDVLYRVAFDRFFMFIDRLKLVKNGKSSTNTLSEIVTNLVDDDKFFENVSALRAKWFDNPTDLLEFIRCSSINDLNDVFPLILHGDFNRNNILFQYDKSEGFDDPKCAKLIDFQELRYGTPTIDLSFLMYMNMDPSIRDEFWMELLEFYHGTMINSIANILNIDVGHESLNPYRFKPFYEHFTKYAFYGVLICMHFLPWMSAPTEDVEKLSKYFETDMHGNDFRQISLEAGGDETDKLIVEIVKHASKMGYMEFITKG